MCISDKLKHFDPNGVGNASGNIFGLPFHVAESKLIMIPMPWDVTVSNLAGTSRAPGLIAANSSQIDLYDPFFPNSWKQGIAMEAVDADMVDRNAKLREQASAVIHFLEQGGHLADNPGLTAVVAGINEACIKMTSDLEAKCRSLLDQGKIPMVVGGDHSVSLGLLRALANRHPGLGVLQIDAHADLRYRYQGFSHSHASIMWNVLHTQGVGTIVQVGVRELCDDEHELIGASSGKIITWFDRDMFQQMAQGISWETICLEMVRQLPEKVYVSFDADGMDPSVCPHTGTPVPGGLSYNQAMFLLETIVNQGKIIVGSDFVETGAHEFDAMIACRILYRMAGMMLKSQQ